MSSKNNARSLAVKALCRVDADGAYSNIALNSILSESDLSPEDKAFCTTIFYGTLDRRISLDYILKQFITSGFGKIKPFTLNLLRSAVYQIKYMDRVPDSAAVNEAVNIIKASKESYGRGFVNGVLRNIARSNIELPSGNSISDISVRYSCPEWIVSILVNYLSENTAVEFLKETLSPPPTYIRINAAKISESALCEILASENVEFIKTDMVNALKIRGYSTIERLDAYKQGLFHVQDISCQKAISMLGIEDNDCVLDMCSAPGGKAFTAATSAKNVSIVACDIYKHRVELIRQGVKRLELNNIIAKVCDASVFMQELGQFDKIICDVPCSGLGVLRRKPDIKYKEPENLDELNTLQMNMLSNADKYLVNGGKILYSTCTLNVRENEDIVNAFLDSHTDYKITDVKTFLPQKDDSDGFFAAVLQKN